MKEQVFMWRMRAKEARNHFQDAAKEDYGHGVTNQDLTLAFQKADDLYEALHTIELKLEDNDEDGNPIA